MPPSAAAVPPLSRALGRVPAQRAARAEIPAEGAARAHLHQLRQVVSADAERVGWAGRDADATLDAAAGVDHRPFQLPEPDLARSLVDIVHLVADGERSGHWLTSPLRGTRRVIVDRKPSFGIRRAHS